MTSEREKEAELSQDIRVTITQKIWAYATGMLALCLIFSPNGGRLLLPIVVVGGAAAGTAVVWRSEQKSQHALQPNQLKQIEERLANLETIVGSDDLELRLKIKQLESSHSEPQT